MKTEVPHICVCICTYKRPESLKRLLRILAEQQTGGRFRFSVAIADNDAARSAEAVVNQVRQQLSIPIVYVVEPRQGISWARNAVLGTAKGDYVAMIDDDEFPQSDWLLRMFETCETFRVDGVLGPVKQHFETTPAAWILKSHLIERKIHPTGTAVEWHEARTGNAFLRQTIFNGNHAPFRTELKSGEDKEFFYRKIKEGFHLIWSSEAIVYETYSPQRCKRRYFLRRSLLNGSMSLRMPDFGLGDIVKSIVAIPLYLLLLPFFLCRGEAAVLRLLFKLSFHVGRMLALMNIHVNSGAYLES